MNRRQRKKHHSHAAEKLRADIEAVVFDYLMELGTLSQADIPTLAGLVSDILPPTTRKDYTIEVQKVDDGDKAQRFAPPITVTFPRRWLGE